MCDLGVGVAVAIGAASAAASQKAQSDAASQQNKYRSQLGIAQNERYRKTVEAVTQDVGLQIDQLAQREIEQAAAIRQQMENYARNARQAGATTRAATAAAGIEGRTVDLLHSEFERDIAEFESASVRAFKSFKGQSAMEAQAIYARGQNAINNGYPNPLPPVATVSPATNILNGITTGMAAYGALSSFNAPPGVAPAANPTTSPLPSVVPQTQTPFGTMLGKFETTRIYSPISF